MLPYAFAGKPAGTRWPDGIFLEAMLVLGVARWKALAMFVAVRLYSETVQAGS